MISVFNTDHFQTPNYGLEPTDIPRFVARGPARGTNDYIILHQLKPLHSEQDTHPVLSSDLQANLHPHTAYTMGAHIDTRFSGTGLGLLLPLPPNIILDYLYGVAAYKCWRSEQKVHDVMSTYRREQYDHIPLLPRPSPTASDATVAGVFFDDDDPRDLDYDPVASQETAPQEDEMAQTMDDLNLMLMRVNGITPQDLADKWAKQLEEEVVAQEKSRRKVMAWMGTSSSELSSNAAYRPGNTFPSSHLSSNSAYRPV